MSKINLRFLPRAVGAFGNSHPATHGSTTAFHFCLIVHFSLHFQTSPLHTQTSYRRAQWSTDCKAKAGP